MSKERGAPEIGKRLRAIRGEMNQRGFASRLHVSQQAISNYEQGNVPESWDFLRRLSRDSGINLHWLLEGAGTRDLRTGTPLASLSDNRPADWPRAFLDQVAFEETDMLELLLHYYLLYLVTEPTDVKAHLMGDLQKLIAATRSDSKWREAPVEARDVLSAAFDALARDDRGAVVDALLRVGEWREGSDKWRALAKARKLYLSVLSLARLQGWSADELESARRIGRSYRKEGHWGEAAFFYRVAIATFEEGSAALADEHGSAAGNGDPAAPSRSSNGPAATGEARSRQVVPPDARARALLGYGHVAREQGDLALARTRYLSALRWALESPEAGMRAEVYLDLACLSYREKDLKKAAEFVTAGRTFAQRAGSAKLINQFELADGLVLRERGELDAAEGTLRRLVLKTQGDRDLNCFSLASLNLAEVLADQDRVDEAGNLLASTAAVAEEHGDPRNLALRMLLQARLAAVKGEEATAGAWLLDCIRYSRNHGLNAEFEQAAAYWTGRQPAAAARSGFRTG
jgi:transcriptional regulator with XRE-family HTH domain